MPRLLPDEGDQSADDGDVLDHVNDLIGTGSLIPQKWTVDRDRREHQERNQNERYIGRPEIEQQAKPTDELNQNDAGKRDCRNGKTDRGQDRGGWTEAENLSQAGGDEEECDDAPADALEE